MFIRFDFLLTMKSSKDKRQKIINTAIKQFVKNGVHHTSIQALAKKAGVATGSIYTYFDSKDNLVADIFYHIAEEGIAVITKDYNENQSVKTRFRYLLEKKIRFNIENPDKFRFLAMCSYEPVIMQTVLSNRCENSPLRSVLEDGKKEKLIKDLPVYDLFYQIFGGVGALLEWRLFNQQRLTAADIDSMVTMAWDAIRR